MEPDCPHWTGDGTAGQDGTNAFLSSAKQDVHVAVGLQLCRTTVKPESCRLYNSSFHAVCLERNASVGSSICLQGPAEALMRPVDKTGAGSVWPRGPVGCILSLHLTHCSLCLFWSVVRCLIGAVTVPPLFILFVLIYLFPGKPAFT